MGLFEILTVIVLLVAVLWLAKVWGIAFLRKLFVIQKEQQPPKLPIEAEETPLPPPEESNQTSQVEASQAISHKTDKDDKDVSNESKIQQPETAPTDTHSHEADGAFTTYDEESPSGTDIETQIKTEPQPTSSEQLMTIPSEDKGPKPSGRGGRPRTSTRDDQKQKIRKARLRTFKPEIVCWKRERQWVLAVELPDELLEMTDLTVLQSGSELSKEESEEAVWPLTQVSGQVTVRWVENEGFQEVKVELGHNDFLLFKLCGQNLGQGRLVKSVSSGSYLVIAPHNWQRDEQLAGPAPVTAEPVALDGCTAYFFDLEKGDSRKIAFQLPEGQSLCIEKKESQFELVGTRIDDAPEDLGPLFGGGPPRIRVSKQQIWENVGTIVIGQEGTGRGRWRMAFKPNGDTADQELPNEVADRKGGWYFLRFYNEKDELIESMDFRFMSGLKQMRIQHPSCIPDGEGHKPVCVEFHHDPDCTVRQSSNAAGIEVQTQNGKTVLTIPSDPACDRSCWLVSQKDGPQVEVFILIERIWWAVAEENEPPLEWQDRPVVLCREEFRATSTKALWLRLPKRRWVDELLIGFEQSGAGKYPVRVNETTVAIPLREFSDAKEVVDNRDEHDFKVWIKKDGKLAETLVAKISAQQPPEPEAPRSLNLDVLSASRLATVLTSLRRKTSGPLRLLIKEVRRKYRREKTANAKYLTEFKIHALCVIAMVAKLLPQNKALMRLYAKEARLAERNFPEIIRNLQSLYDEIRCKHSRNHRMNQI